MHKRQATRWGDDHPIEEWQANNAGCDLLRHPCQVVPLPTVLEL